LSLIDRAWELFQRRRLAYVRTFCAGNGDIHPEAERVLKDLRRYCHVDKPGIVVSPVSRSVDPYATAYRAGMRDVYQRIANFLDHQLQQEIERERRDPANQHQHADNG
jgi:hypothetical protein